MKSSAGVLALVLLLAASGCKEEYKFYGLPLTPEAAAPTSSLVSGDGTIASVGVPGEASLVFFGYTNCPDICPTTLADWKRVKAALGKSAPLVNFVFVTIDPDHDTPEVMRNYVARFDSSFVGLSGSAAQIDSVSRAFGVTAFADGTLESGHPAMAHPSRVYLVDPQGMIRFVYPPGLKPEEIAEDIRHVL